MSTKVKRLKFSIIAMYGVPSYIIISVDKYVQIADKLILNESKIY